MSACIQWKKSRVSGVMSEAFPAQTEIAMSITFMEAKPATASARMRRCISFFSASSGRCGSNG